MPTVGKRPAKLEGNPDNMPNIGAVPEVLPR